MRARQGPADTHVQGRWRARTERIELYFFAGHTNGDARLVFRRCALMRVADAFDTRDLPFMNANNGGRGVDYLVKLAEVTPHRSGRTGARKAG